MANHFDSSAQLPDIMAKRKYADSDPSPDDRRKKPRLVKPLFSSLGEPHPDGTTWLNIGKLFFKTIKSPEAHVATLAVKTAVTFRPIPGPGGALVFYVDGSRDETGRSSSVVRPAGGFGLVYTFPCLVDGMGGIALQERAYRIDHCVSSVHSELSAIIEAFSIASDVVEQRSWYGMRVKVFSDCLSAFYLIKQSTMKPESFQKSRHSNLLPAIQTLERLADRLANYGAKIELHWVPRNSSAEISMADRLAAEAREPAPSRVRELSARTQSTQGMDLAISRLASLLAVEPLSKRLSNARRRRR